MSNTWEEITDKTHNTFTQSLKIDGGTLYRVMSYNENHITASCMVFVPSNAFVLNVSNHPC